MFERFTERARRVIVLAQEEAHELEHEAVDTVHLLLGLLREGEGRGARALAACGVTLDAAREQALRRAIPAGQPAAGQIPFTPAAKRVLEAALRESFTLGYGYMGTEHLLLGIAREEDGLELLLALGVDEERIRTEVVKLLSGVPAMVEPRAVPRPLRWRYRVEEVAGLDSADALAGMGDEGWELVSVFGEPDAYRAVFKRPA